MIQNEKLKFAIIAVAGIVLIIGLHYYLDLSWSKDASYDIIFGAIIEFSLLQMLLRLYTTRQEKRFQKHLEYHLRQIERKIEKIQEMTGDKRDV